MAQATKLPLALKISPPLVNSANPWATNLEDLTALYACPQTGAVTTRTSLLKGFAHDASRHQFTLFDAATHVSEQNRTNLSGNENASLNNLGYSPFPVDAYLAFIETIAASPAARKDKGFIISVTGSPGEVVECYQLIAAAQARVPFPLAMEINLSCPNISGKPPPAYDGKVLLSYLTALQDATRSSSSAQRIPFGIKTPPYTHAAEYDELFTALRDSCAASDGEVCPISFITATNTLGSCLVLSSAQAISADNALPGTGLGGMAGAPLHPLALGNVRTIRQRLDENKGKLGHIQIIGVGGVMDASGYARMKSVGADFVGVGTGLGINGVGVFGKILGDS